MNAPDPKLVALAYHDGPTEGFISGLLDGRVHFFKVAAWDEGQDQRLYLLGEVATLVYSELLEILRVTHPALIGSIWVPAWTFDDPDLERRAKSLVEIGERSLDNPALAALGESLVGEVTVFLPNDDQLARAIALIRADKPGELTNWLELGK